MKRIAFAVAASVVFWCLIVSFASASELTLIGKSAKPPTLVPWTRSLDITVRVVSLYPFELSNNGWEWTSWYPGSTTATEIPWTIAGDYSGTKWVYAVVDKRTAGFGYEQLTEKIVYEADNPSVIGLVLNRRSLTTNKRPRIWAYAIPGWGGGLKFWGEVKNSKGRRVAGFGKTAWVNNNNYYWTPRGPRTAGYFAAGKYKVTVHAMTYSGRVGFHSFTMTVH